MSTTLNPWTSPALEHERVVVRRGPRSGAPIIVAVHSTTLGQAVGGCRVMFYPNWRDGLTDALRLSEAMTDKCALAGLPHGGGKTVVALPAGTDLSADPRKAVLTDVGNVIEDLGGLYATGPDIGTGSADMDIIGEVTRHVTCRTARSGGSGDSSPSTARGALAAITAACGAQFGSTELGRRSYSVIGLGRVGAIVAHELSATGARLVVADTDPQKFDLARHLGATWTSPQDALAADVDVVVPAATGGLLNRDSIPQLSCAVVAGPANNQLAQPTDAALLHQRGIVWVPDPIVSAGGVVHATAMELRGETEQQIDRLVAGIGDTVTTVLVRAREAGLDPARAARDLVEQRLAAAGEAHFAGRHQPDTSSSP